MQCFRTVLISQAIQLYGKIAYIRVYYLQIARDDDGETAMQSSRLDIRLNPETKSLIQEAAELQNQTITQFVVAALSDAAGKVVTEHKQTVLTDRDRDRFLALLDAPPAPNKALKAAVKRYRSRSAQ